MSSIDDIVIIGGGVIGLSIARELAIAGESVTVVDRTQIGTEASWAGAGMLPTADVNVATTPFARLRALSWPLWEPLSQALLDRTGIDNGFRRCGGLEVRPVSDDETLGSIDDEAEVLDADGCRYRRLTPDALHDLEPELDPHLGMGLHLPDLSQVRNPRHLKALIADCDSRGVTFAPGLAVVGFQQAGDRITAVQTPKGDIAGGRFVLATGAWTGPLLEPHGVTNRIEPVRGQIVLLSTPNPVLRHVVMVGPRYLVPRDDGRLIVGSTQERVGFEKRTTGAGVAELLRFAFKLVPALRDATVERTWAGLRPGSHSPVPSMGRVPVTENLFVAAGHFRDGLQLSPITGRILRQMVRGEPIDPLLDPNDFAICCPRATAGSSRSGI